uniref:rhomboid protease n=1 Tax=Steinernema glaseri TaxID=37863 RepID=A0A1I7Y7E7_9BILA
MLVLRSAILRSCQTRSLALSARSFVPPRIRLLSFSLQNGSRFSREFSKLRPRVDTARRPPPSPTRFKQVADNTILPDFVGLRPGRDLLKCLAFTGVVGFGAFTIAAITDYRRRRLDFDRLTEIARNFFNQNHDQPTLSEGQKCALALVALNVAVTLLWRVKPLAPAMWRYFSNSFASKSLTVPMVLSTFSHHSVLHLVVNMYCLFSFTHITIDKFLGVDQFLAFFLTAGAVSSLTSLVQKLATRSTIRSLGASGAILAVLTYTCMMIPEARLSVVFLPQFDFSAQNAVYGLLAFDLLGLLFRFKLFDHAAHLGGSLFGILYALYGEDLWKLYYQKVVKTYRRVIEGTE